MREMKTRKREKRQGKEDIERRHGNEKTEDEEKREKKGGK